MEWAESVLSILANYEETDLKKELKPVCALSTEYLTHLVIAARNPGGKKTPQESVHPTPDLIRTQTIQQLLDDAKIERKQSALRELIFKRDGDICLLTRFPFRGAGRTVVARCAHILPFSFRDKLITLKTIETFTGRAITAETVHDYINHPSDAFNVETNAHDSFDRLQWGIEAVQKPGGQWQYLFREITSSAATIALKDGDEIRFGAGTDHAMIDAPNPQFCNLHLSLARVLYACGASEIIEHLYGDDDDEDAIVNQPVYFGGPFTSDDTLFRRLHDRLSF